jgi:transcriptional regulator with XRE-family HTH domain
MLFRPFEKRTTARIAQARLAVACDAHQTWLLAACDEPSIRTRAGGAAFGDALRVERRRRGLGQEQLAERCDFDRTYLSVLELGLRTPAMTVLLKPADALDLAPERTVSETLVRLAPRRPRSLLWIMRHKAAESETLLDS